MVGREDEAPCDEPTRFSTDRSRACAANIECRMRFTKNVAGMHLLSFLLTARPTKAQELLCLRIGPLRRRKLHISRLGEILGAADDNSAPNSHVGTSKGAPAEVSGVSARELGDLAFMPLGAH